MTTSHAHEVESVTGILGDDHDRLDSMLDQAFDFTGADPEQARRIFATFSSHLLRHMEVEDEQIFTRFERLTGVRDGGPSAVLRREHREIELRLAHISQALAARPPDAATARMEMSELRDLLVDHHHLEEAVLYTVCDRQLDVGEIRAIRAALEKP
jgi:iron-sulfur cluster repair protein YtfE (RIC family)